jgi:HD-GYP domain-containing protein (c-di-GMP phosphodiesterase class II)
MKPDERVYTVVETREVSVHALERGMYVCRLDRPWEETPFLFQGFRLESESDIRALQRHCDHVFIDIRRSRHLAPKKASDTRSAGVITRITRVIGKGRQDASHPYPPRSRLSRDLKPAMRTYDQTSRLVKSLMDEIRLGNSVNTPAAKETVSHCVESVIANPDAMLLLSRLKNKDEYTSEHSLNVAIIAIAFGRHLGMDKDQLNEIGLSGMLHDMGKIVTPPEVLNKPGPLEGDEIEVMKRHPADGREILMSSPGIHDSAIDVAYGHHERMDGSGYPRGLESGNLSLFTKMIAIADVFDAVTSDRVYRDGVSSFHALRMLHGQRGRGYDPSLIIKFIECIGIFPIGTVVEMHNGEVGLVVQTHPRFKLKPRVRLLLNGKGVPMEPRIVDLAADARDAAGQPYRVRSAHNPKRFGIDLKQFIREQSREE